MRASEMRMQTTLERLSATSVPWRRGLSALFLALSLALGAPAGARAAAPGGGDCVPAEPPMGSAREDLGGHNKDGGVRAQDRAIDELKRCRAAQEREVQDLLNTLGNLQMAQPGQQDDGDDDMNAALDELGDMIRQQQQLRDKTFKEGQDQRRQQRGQGQRGQQGNQNFGDLQKNQQALRDRLKKLMEQLRQKGLGQQPGDDSNGEPDPLGEAGSAMDEAQNALGDKNADGAVDGQGRALDALRKKAQSLAQQGPGPGGDPRGGNRQRAQNDTDPLGRPLGHDDGSKVPLEADVQRARRILEELRRRYGDTLRPQIELDYIERLLKGY
jgi:Spy/CpxP family protein refolding chaperone